MLNIGSTYEQPIYVYDRAGVLADATVTLVIALPDGTSSGSLALTHTGTGIYTPGYVTTQAGRHVAVATVAAGGNVSADVISDVFDVFPADTGALVSLESVKRSLNIASTNTTHDEQLLEYIAAASIVLDDLGGPFVARTCVDTCDGGGTDLVLLNQPMISVTSVVEAGTTLAATDYAVDLLSGTLTRMVGIQPYPFRFGRQNIVVTYRAGYTVIPANVQLAARELVRSWWQDGQQGGRPAFGGSAASEPPPVGYETYRRVVELLNNNITPGIA